LLVSHIVPSVQKGGRRAPGTGSVKASRLEEHDINLILCWKKKHARRAKRRWGEHVRKELHHEFGGCSVRRR